MSKTETSAPAQNSRTALASVMLAGMCTFLNVYCTQPLLPFLTRLFHASELEVSLTVSATTFGVAIGAPIIGMVAERLGRKKVIVPALFLLTIPTAMAGTSNSLHAMIIWRFLQGLCVPGIIAVILAYIGEEWAGRGVGRAMSLYVTGTVIGGFLGRFIAGLIVSHWHWRAAFFVIGGLNLIGAILVRQWLPPAKNFVKAPHLGHALDDMKTHLRNPRLLANFGMGFAVLFTLVGAFTYVNFYLAAPPFLLSPAQLGSVFFVYLLGVIVTPLSGRYLDHHGFFKTAVLSFSMSVAGMLLTLVRSLPAVIIGLALFSSGVFIAQAAATVQTGVLAGRARSSAAGLYVTLYYIGGSAGAVATGWMWMWRGWPSSIAMLLLVATLSLVLASLSSRDIEPRDVPELMNAAD